MRCCGGARKPSPTSTASSSTKEEREPLVASRSDSDTLDEVTSPTPVPVATAPTTYGTQEPTHEMLEVTTEEFDYVMAFPHDPPAVATMTKQDILHRLHQAGLIYEEIPSTSVVFLKIRADTARLQKEAARVHLPLLLDETELASLATTGLQSYHIEPFAVENPPLKFIDHFKRPRYPPYKCIYMPYAKNEPPSIYAHHDGDFFSHIHRMQLLESILTNVHGGGAGLDLENLLAQGVLLACYPLHNVPQKIALQRSLLSWCSRPWKQPLEEIRDYFGPKIALYFAYSGHYATWLLGPALLGLAITLWQLYPVSIPEPYADWTVLHYVLPIYGVLMLGWGSFFLKHWSRRNAVLAMEWGMSDFDRVRKVVNLPQAPTTFAQRLLRYGLSWVVVALLVAAAAVVAGAAVNVYAASSAAWLRGNATLLALLLAAQITVVSYVFRLVGVRLNEYENHSTEATFELAYVLKIVVVELCSAFAGLLYAAFVASVPLAELPWIVYRVYGLLILAHHGASLGTVRRLSVQARAESASFAACPAMEKQFAMAAYGWLESAHDHLTLVVHFAFATLLAVVTPFVPVLALLHQTLELRLTGSKLLYFCRRPRPREAATLGAWLAVLHVMLTAALCTNAALLVQINRADAPAPATANTTATPDEASTSSLTWSLIAAFVCFRLVITVAYQNVPSRIRLQLERQAYYVAKLYYKAFGWPAHMEKSKDQGARFDYALIFPNPEGAGCRDPDAMNRVLAQLDAAGLQYKIYPSAAKQSTYMASHVLCEVRATEGQLAQEAARIQLPMLLDEMVLKDKAHEGVFDSLHGRLVDMVDRLRSEAQRVHLVLLLQNMLTQPAFLGDLEHDSMHGTTSMMAEKLESFLAALDHREVRAGPLELERLLHEFKERLDVDIEGEQFRDDEALESCLYRMESWLGGAAPVARSRRQLEAPAEPLAQERVMRHMVAELEWLRAQAPLNDLYQRQHSWKFNLGHCVWFMEQLLLHCDVSPLQLVARGADSPLKWFHMHDYVAEFDSERLFPNVSRLLEECQWLLAIPASTPYKAFQEFRARHPSSLVLPLVDALEHWIIATPDVDIVPFYLGTPDPRYNLLAKRFKYRPYQYLHMPYTALRLSKWQDIYAPTTTHSTFFPTQRAVLLDSLLSRHVDLDELLAAHVVTAAYPLHDDAELRQLEGAWRSWAIAQPLDAIKNYFGPAVAMYFGYLGHATKWLAVAAVGGVAVVVADAFDAAPRVAVPLFGVAMVVWATLYVKHWTRAKVILELQWGLTTDGTTPPPVPAVRAAYTGDFIRNPVTGQKMKYFRKNERLLRLALSWTALTLLLAVDAGGVALLFSAGRGGFLIEPAYSVPFLLGLWILACESAFFPLGTALTVYENHRTDVSHEDAFVLKSALFHVLNSFGGLAALFVLADDLLPTLRVSLYVVYGTQVVYRVASTLLAFALPAAPAKSAEAQLAQVELDWPALVQVHVHRVLHLGYVLLFVVACPLAPLLGFAHHFVEMRLQALTLTAHIRRPRPRPIARRWYLTMLQWVLTLAIGANAYLVVYASHILDGDEQLGVLQSVDGFCGLLVLLLLLRGAVNLLFADLPLRVTSQLERQNFVVERILQDQPMYLADPMPKASFLLRRGSSMSSEHNRSDVVEDEHLTDEEEEEGFSTPLVAAAPRPKLAKYSSVPNMAKPSLFPARKTADPSELKRFLSTPIAEEGEYGATSAADDSVLHAHSHAFQRDVSQVIAATGHDNASDVRVPPPYRSQSPEWDFVIVFPNPELRAPTEPSSPAANAGAMSMSDILTKLRQAGLDTQLSKSSPPPTAGKEKYVPPFVYCKIRASLDRLKLEAARVHMALPLVENQLERMAKQGEVRFHIESPEDRIAEMQRQGFEPLPPEKRAAPRRTFKKVRYEPGSDVDVFDLFDLHELEEMAAAGGGRHPGHASGSSWVARLSLLLRKFKYKPYQFIHMHYHPQDNIQCLYGSPLFPTTKRIRLLESIITSPAGAGLDLDRLLKTQAIAACYPLHEDDTRRDIRDMWNSSLWLTHQPIEATREYFGGQVALFLAYVAHMTRWLLVPSLCGLALLVLNKPYLVWLFGLFMVCWSTLFLKMWKRKLAVLGMKWGMADYHAPEHDKPSFDDERNWHVPRGSVSSLVFRRVLSLFVLLLLVGCVGASVGGLFYLRFQAEQAPAAAAWHLGANYTLAVAFRGELHLVALANVVCIYLWALVFNKLHAVLNDYEVYHTEAAAQQAYILKAMGFHFVNHFAGPIYVAFIKTHVEGVRAQFAGPDIEAVAELKTYMLFLYGAQLVVHNVWYVLLPWSRYLLGKTRRRLQARRHLNSLFGAGSSSVNDEPDGPPPKKLAVEVQFRLRDYGWKGLFNDYFHMVVQFGYATLFVVSCPYLPLMACVHNIVAIRVHGVNLTTLFRRPSPRSAQQIRLWTFFLELLCTLAIGTNAWAIVAKARLAQRALDLTDLPPLYYVQARWACIAGITIVLFGLSSAFSFAINDIPSRVRVQLERQEYYVSKVLHLGYRWDKAMHAINFQQSQDELEATEGFGWDYAIVFPNPEVRRPPRLHPLTGKVEPAPSMRDMLLKLHKAGLQVHFFDSAAIVSSYIPSMVLCKVRASRRRLEAEADRIKMPMLLNAAEMARQARHGVVLTVCGRLAKHIAGLEAEIDAIHVAKLLVEMIALKKLATHKPLDAAKPAASWSQLLLELFVVLDAMAAMDQGIKTGFQHFKIENTQFTKRSTPSQEALDNHRGELDALLQAATDADLSNVLDRVPSVLQRTSATLTLAARELGIQLTLLPIITKPKWGMDKAERAETEAVEKELRATMTHLANVYAGLQPLLSKMEHLLQLSLPLQDLHHLSDHLRFGKEMAGEPSVWLAAELDILLATITDITADAVELRAAANPLAMAPEAVQTISARVAGLLAATVANPLIDIQPFHLANPNPAYSGLAKRFRYGPYECIHMPYQAKEELQHWYQTHKATTHAAAPDQLFSSTQRIALLESIVTDSETGAGLNLERLVLSGAIKGHFPLHDEHVQKAVWARWKWSLLQPIDDICGYFGVKIALYFAYLGHYTTWLTLSSAAGLSVVGIQVVHSRYTISQTELDWVKIYSVPVYGTFIIVWATLFLKHWIRKQTVFALKWGMSDYHEEEQLRPQFTGDLMRDPITGARMRYFNDGQRRRRLLYSWFILAVLICVVLLCVSGIFWLRMFVHQRTITVAGVNVGTELAAMANVMQIFILSQLYNRVSGSLNEYENHRTDTQYENHFIGKAIVFQFVNNFALLFYVAFLKETLEGCNKDTGGCMGELKISLVYVYGSQLVMGNCQELIVPLFWAHIERVQHEWVKKDKDEPEISAVESQFFMPTYGWRGTFDDYLEMIIQFGYSTFFVIACPFAPCMSWINNFFEIRIDASKLSTFARRPRPSGASTIGQWVHVLEVFVSIAIVTNAWVIVSTSDLTDLMLETFPSLKSNLSTLGVFFGVAGGLFTLRYAINSAIDDMPSHVHAQLRRQKFVVGQILSMHEDVTKARRLSMPHNTLAQNPTSAV
ncbi:anoctamin-like protein [Achlya hypogyna]|uniref:Anoctamin-like protein n=1 Tax=Achlya hypogyna TaxID=1202772 RepID=A0A1V9YI53_ACHHY|nr:anoctamin-like protein [Achlya hypogyna]